MRLYESWCTAVISEHKVLSALLTVEDTAVISEHEVVSGVRVVSTYQIRKHAEEVRKGEGKVLGGEGRGTHGVKPKVWENHQQIQHKRDNTTLYTHTGESVLQQGAGGDARLGLLGAEKSYDRTRASDSNDWSDGERGRKEAV
jgi:hypothetical protein